MSFGVPVGKSSFIFDTQQNILALDPSSYTESSLFFTTDTNIVLKSNGTSWFTTRINPVSSGFLGYTTVDRIVMTATTLSIPEMSYTREEGYSFDAANYVVVLQPAEDILITDSRITGLLDLPAEGETRLIYLMLTSLGYSFIQTIPDESDRLTSVVADIFITRISGDLAFVVVPDPAIVIRPRMAWNHWHTHRLLNVPKVLGYDVTLAGISTEAFQIEIPTYTVEFEGVNPEVIENSDRRIVTRATTTEKQTFFEAGPFGIVTVGTGDTTFSNTNQYWDYSGGPPVLNTMVPERYALHLVFVDYFYAPYGDSNGINYILRYTDNVAGYATIEDAKIDVLSYIEKLRDSGYFPSFLETFPNLFAVASKSNVNTIDDVEIIPISIVTGISGTTTAADEIKNATGSVLAKTDTLDFYIQTDSLERFRIAQGGKTTIDTLNLASIGTYNNDGAAAGGGLAAGDVYKTATGELRIKL